MKTFARLNQDGAVEELVETAANISTLFHPALHWVDVTGQNVTIGDVKQGDKYVRSAGAPPPAAAAPTLAELQAEIAHLTARMAALAAASTKH